jgi:hypothetical protein
MRKLLDTLHKELKELEDKYNNLYKLHKDPSTLLIMRIKMQRKINSKKEVIKKREIVEQETAAAKKLIWDEFNKNYYMFLDSDNI